MPKLPVVKPGGSAEAEDRTAESLGNTICRSVLAALGRPDHFLRITVRQVTSDGHRVNVLTGQDASSARIAHSYFITADDKGNVTGSSPTLKKLY